MHLASSKKVLDYFRHCAYLDEAQGKQRSERERQMSDFIICTGGIHWPGLMPHRSRTTRKGRGYPSLEAAQERFWVLMDHWHRNNGGCGPTLRIIERT